MGINRIPGRLSVDCPGFYCLSGIMLIHISVAPRRAAMRRFFRTLFFLVVMLLILVDAASAFRCGTRLVNIGDRKAEILGKCGPPDWVDFWEEDRIERVFGFSYSDDSFYLGTRIPTAAVVRVPIEEWTYNSGPTQFIRILKFENSRLISIETGGYGY